MEGNYHQLLPINTTPHAQVVWAPKKPHAKPHKVNGKFRLAYSGAAVQMASLYKVKFSGALAFTQTTHCRKLVPAMQVPPIKFTGRLALSQQAQH